MKAIGIKMVELQPMTAREANDKGHRIGNHSFEEEGYEVTYPDGYKSWSPKDVADAAYYPLSENNDGTKILKEDVENFITDVEVMKVGEKLLLLMLILLLALIQFVILLVLTQRITAKNLANNMLWKKLLIVFGDILDLFFNGLNTVLILNNYLN